MTPTGHALKRWAERFPEEDIELDFARSSRTGKKWKRKIRASCPDHAHLVQVTFKGVYYRFSRFTGAVFVCAPPETIITVLKFDLPNKPKRKGDREAAHF